MKPNNKGQTLLSVIMWAAGVSIACAGVASTMFMNQLEKIDNSMQLAQVERKNNFERTAKLEEAITTLKTDNTEIKNDIKQILKLLK